MAVKPNRSKPSRLKPSTFVRLKLRITANGLRGSTSRVVLFVVGILFGIGGAVGGFFLLALPGFLDDTRVAGIMLPLAGTGLLLGWLLLPLIFFGVDESLDPARFALLPLSRRTLITGLFAAATLGIPAIATLLASGGVVLSAALLGGPGAALAQLVGVILGLLLFVAVSRAVTSAFATALRSRRARDLATVLLAVTAALLGPLQLGLLAGAERADWDRVAQVADVIAWTPLGAAYSLGTDVAEGRAWAVPVKILIVVVSIVALLAWWSSTVERAMLGTAASGQRAVKAGGSRSAVARLMVRGLPQNRFGALMSREVRYWWRETRRRASLITLGVVGVFLPVTMSVNGGGSGFTVLFIGALASISLANQFGFEGNAYAANVVAGVPGRTEVQSRAAAFSLFVVPLLILIATVVSVTAGHPEDLASRLGTLLAAYGIGLGVVLPVSVRGAYALPSTSNPFAMSSGAGPAKGLLAMGVLLAAVVGTVPMLVAAWLLDDGVWRWAGLPIGLIYGGAAYLIGSRLAGNLLDRRMPELLSAITPE
ncbi:ABC transporter permease [Actinoplanes sp. NBRC 103695]|uniref:ABC transporter permease n=1 Tax=Actinoplanes sp. NBRC 103695 TaxID=3032202 RepID=UPI0025549453|nr:ABC transporter permease [Actinoplanes sp. NBRC 103695]